MSRAATVQKFLVKREMQIRKARASFWHFCQWESPDFYQDHRHHLRSICNTLQALYDGTLLKPDGTPYAKLMLNMPPRMGKSRTLVNFTKWAFGKNPGNRVITGSYNDEMAQDFSRYTRDGISEGKTYPHEIAYNDIFPETHIKQGNASYGQWALEGQFFSYKGAGVGGSVTGKGCNIAIVDDPVKDAETAYNENALAKIWRWYTGTFMSRLEKGGIEILNMTRWAKGDLCGQILAGPDANEWYILKLEARDDETGVFLCPDLLDEKTYNLLSRNMDEAIFRANYHQEPIDIKGRLYKEFKTYVDIPKDDEGNPLFERIISYTDTADTGNDYLVSIAAGQYNGELYILDVLFTKDGMEVTEPLTAEFMFNNRVNLSVIESNNGGRGFARNVERLIFEKYKTRSVTIRWLHQTKNKVARILSNSTYIMQHVYYPVNFKDRWPEYYNAMISYQKEGKNKNDDAPDATTGLVEILETATPRVRML